MPNLKLIRAIINFLKDEGIKPDVSSDTKESLEVAVQCLQTAYDIDSNDDSSDNNLPFSIEDIFQSALLSLTGDKGSSEKNLQNAEMMKNLGNKLMKTNQFTEAVKCYTAAIDLDNQNSIYYGNRAAAYSKLNDFKNAITDCEKAIEIDPKYAKAYGRMGLAFASLDQNDHAIKAFKKAVELDPTNESYRSNLKIAEDKKDKPVNSLGGLAGLSSVDWQTLFTNPAFRNMASTLMQDPNIISSLSASMASTLNQGQAPPPTTPPPPPPSSTSTSTGTGLDINSGSSPNSTPGRSLDMLLEAGQYLAAQMQAANPDLVEQFRQITSRTFARQNQDNGDSPAQ